MNIIQITSGSGSTDDQAGVKIGKKYIHIHRMNRNCEWERSKEKVLITPELQDMIDCDEVKTQDFKDMLFSAKFRQGLEI